MFILLLYGAYFQQPAVFVLSAQPESESVVLRFNQCVYAFMRLLAYLCDDVSGNLRGLGMGKKFLNAWRVDCSYRESVGYDYEG